MISTQREDGSKIKYIFFGGLRRGGGGAWGIILHFSQKLGPSKLWNIAPTPRYLRPSISPPSRMVDEGTWPGKTVRWSITRIEAVEVQGFHLYCGIAYVALYCRIRVLFRGSEPDPGNLSWRSNRVFFSRRWEPDSKRGGFRISARGGGQEF